MSAEPRDFGLNDVEPDRSDPHDIDQPGFVTQFVDSLRRGLGGDKVDREEIAGLSDPKLLLK